MQTEIGGVRIAKHAGSWYKKQTQALNEQLTKYLSKAQLELKDIKRIKAVIGPHAGLTYSGPVAAWGYNYLSKFLNPQKSNQEKAPLNVFLLGPSHHLYFQGCAITSLGQWETPIGNLKVNQDIVQKMSSEGTFKMISKKQQEAEHSLEMHLPYIRKVFGDKCLLIPLMVGIVSPKLAQEYGKLLSGYFDDQNSLFIVSSDFCHWGSRFDYQPTEKEMKIWEYIKKLDETGMRLIQKNDISSFISYMQKTGNTICGENPIKVLMNTIKFSKYSKELKTSFVRYDQSQKVKDFNDSSVSYATSVTYIPEI